MHGHHSSLLAALREEDTDDEFDDDDAFAFAPKGEGTPSTPRGTHRVFAAGKESMDSPTSPLVTHTKPHTKTYGFAPAPSPPPPPPPRGSRLRGSSKARTTARFRSSRLSPRAPRETSPRTSWARSTRLVKRDATARRRLLAFSGY
jgi:hypothetical protein